MFDQLKTRKASDLDDGLGINESNSALIDGSPSFHVAKKAKREPSMFLRLLANSLSIKHNYRDPKDDALYDEFDEILNGDLSELDEMITSNVILDNFWDSIGYSLIENAVKAGLINIVKLLLKHADKSIMMVFTRYRHPLLKACLKGYVDIAKLLLEQGADPNLHGETHDYDDITYLSYACMANNSGMVELLLKHGADPNLSDGPDQCPPLMQACQPDGLPVVRLLVDYGADVNFSNPEFGTALTYVCGIGSLDMARLLLDGGADVNLIDSYGDTPLIAVCRDVEDEAQVTLIQLLLEHGADPAIPDSQGRVALDYVTEGSELAEMITNAQLEHILK